MVLVARNKKHDPKFVDVILEFHKGDNNNRIEAVKIYKNVEIDSPYKEMLKNSEYYGFVDLETLTMENQLLKFYYESEKVTHSRIKPVARMPIDDENDFLVFTSSATYQAAPYTDLQKTLIDLKHNSIINPSIKKLLSK